MNKPPTKEAEIEKKVCAWALRNGWWVSKFTSPNRRSVPDRIFIRGGYVIFIEFKAPGKRLTPSQEREGKRLRDHGAEVHTCDDVQKGLEILMKHMDTKDVKP